MKPVKLLTFFYSIRHSKMEAFQTKRKALYPRASTQAERNGFFLASCVYFFSKVVMYSSQEQRRIREETKQVFTFGNKREGVSSFLFQVLSFFYTKQEIHLHLSCLSLCLCLVKCSLQFSTFLLAWG